MDLFQFIHAEQFKLIQKIKKTITQHNTLNSNVTILLCEDFNQDIALIGSHTDNTFS
jgi:hypothetical protein